MADIPKVGDLVRMITGGPLMIVKTVITTPSGTVMVGCVPVQEPSIPTIDVPLERLTPVH
ncbi:hypothetical protein SAMN02745157_0142 [Kaistia soli DSM 19436]|uniref:Uncharacterized protein n=1 Tax=Kaistia soli DSM 19436 TaxID=1122133 RepID=A0A1M5PED7_9HYPH|nr:hypothetical protein [Kaistia soli]SHH00111.1 hypothetical protein SAMN02745157_0142 [Kaistia soli DSM 19436]